MSGRTTEGLPVLLDRKQIVTLTALALAALATWHAAMSQPLLDLASSTAMRKITEQLARIESQDGPRSPELIAPLRALGLFYQEGGDHALAAAAVDRAWDLVRMNHGVQSLDQAPLIQQRVEIARARGDLMEAWNLQQALLVIARRHPSDPRTIGILHEIGDERMSVLERYVSGEFPPQIVLGCYFDGLRGDTMQPAVSRFTSDACTAGYRGVAIRSILWEAQMDYSDAIKAAIANDLYSSSELRELELKLVRGHFQYGAMYEDGRDYALGREGLRRLAAYEAAVSAPPSVQIEALIRIADWDLLFARSRRLREAALSMYELAYRRLRETEQDEATIDALFSPETPVVLPTFLSNPLTANETGSGEYLDIGFDVTREGKVRSIEILEAVTASRRSAVRRVTELILRSRFRPRLVDGEFPEAVRITLRYHLPADDTGSGS